MDEALGKAILQAVEQRLTGRKLVCGMCGGTHWISNGIISLPVQDNISAAFVIGGRNLPLVDMTCQVCGMTQFHNIIVLLGRDRFNEIARQQQETKQVMEEAKNILKQKEVEE